MLRRQPGGRVLAYPRSGGTPLLQSKPDLLLAVLQLNVPSLPAEMLIEPLGAGVRFGFQPDFPGSIFPQSFNRGVHQSQADSAAFV